MLFAMALRTRWMSLPKQNQARGHMRSDLDHKCGQTKRKFARKHTLDHMLLPNP